jgi:hypothetical protein
MEVLSLFIYFSVAAVREIVEIISKETFQPNLLA